MKKIIYALLIAFATSLTLSSCTEEEVKPQTDAVSSGGGGGYTGDL